MDTCCEDVVPTVPPQVMKVVSDDGGKLLWRHVLLHGRGTVTASRVERHVYGGATAALPPTPRARWRIPNELAADA